MRKFLPLLLVFLLVGGPSQSALAKEEYVKLDKFVVNVKDGRRTRFMQVKVQVMAEAPYALEALKTHRAAVRHALLMLLSEQEADHMRSPLGREEVRAQALAEVRGVMASVTIGADAAQGDKSQDGGEAAETATYGIGGLYFTDFFIQ